jgi:hypothetical protein
MILWPLILLGVAGDHPERSEPVARWGEGTPTSRNRHLDGRANERLQIVAEGRIFGLNAGDWMMLAGCFALCALALWMLRAWRCVIYLTFGIARER